MSMAAALRRRRWTATPRARDRDCLRDVRRSIWLAPLTSPLARVHARSAHTANADDDRPPAPDIETIATLIARGELDRACAMKVN
jgi:hypothetical protein